MKKVTYKQNDKKLSVVFKNIFYLFTIERYVLYLINQTVKGDEEGVNEQTKRNY